MSYTCPVCGFPNLKESPRSRSGGGSYEICPSCGFQFGVSDDDRGFSYEEWRKQWIENGMQWSSVGIKSPDFWDPSQQIQRLLHA